MSPRALLLAAALLLPAGPAYAAAAKVLDVGIVLRLNAKFNGQFNETVSDMAAGIETAKTMFEKAHPPTTVRLHRYPHDAGLDSVVAAADLVLRDRLPAVIGGELSEEAFVLRDKLGPAKIVFMTPSASHPAVTEGREYSFRACFSDRLVASQLANFTLEHLKARRVGLVRNVSSPYTDFLSRQYAAAFDERAAKRGLKTALTEVEVLRETMDFEPAIDRFKALGVTHVVMPSYQNDVLRFVLQAAGKGFFPIFVGSDGWGSSEQVFAKLVKSSPYGNRFVGFRNSYSREEWGSELARGFEREYTALHQRKPTAAGAIAFDAAWALLTAMEKADDPHSGTAIRDALRSLKDLPMVTSEKLTVGPDNSPKKDLFIYRIDKKGIRYEATLR